MKSSRPKYHTVLFLLFMTLLSLSSSSPTRATIYVSGCDREYTYQFKPGAHYSYPMRFFDTTSGADHYNLYYNGTLIEQGIWQSNQTFFVNVDEPRVGVHNYTLVVYDIAGNGLSCTVMITVTMPPTEEGRLGRSASASVIGSFLAMGVLVIIGLRTKTKDRGERP